jgi:hypothetical protein
LIVTVVLRVAGMSNRPEALLLITREMAEVIVGLLPTASKGMQGFIVDQLKAVFESAGEIPDEIRELLDEDDCALICAEQGLVLE